MVQSILMELKARLLAKDISRLPGKFKAWIYLHGILLRLLWPLLICEVRMIILEVNLTVEFKVTTVIEVLYRSSTVVLYRDPTNPTDITVRTLIKWQAQEAIKLAKAILRHGILACSGLANNRAIPGHSHCA